jgi:hypothetical protein
MADAQHILGALALALIFLITLLFTRAAAYLLSERRLSVTLALGTMLQITIPISICRITENLIAATLLHGLLALFGLGLLWKRGLAAPPAIVPHPRLGRAAWGLALLALVLVVWAARKNFLWDEFNGHDPLVSVIARGVSPPEHPLFPGEPFRYHYGFDVLSGEVRAFTGLFAPDAIDVVTIWCFVMLLVAGASIGADLAGDRGGRLAMLLGPFGTGTLLYLLLPELGRFEIHWSVIPSAWLHSVPPPIISNFFQHPQGLGMPVSLAILQLFDGTEAEEGARTRRIVLGAILLGMLSLAQIVFFLILGAALGVSTLWRAARARRMRPAAIELALLLGALGIAYLLGGFFERHLGPPAAKMIDLGRSFFGEGIGRSILHHLVAFGLPLIAVPLALIRIRERAPALRVALIAAAAIGFIVPNLIVYQRSWDIVKFFGAGGFFANILLADLLAPLFEEGARGRRALGIAIAVLASFVGWFWIVRMSYLDGRHGVPKMHFGPPPRIAEAVAEKLGPLVKPRERIFSTNMDIGAGAGFMTPGFNPTSEGASFMLDVDRAKKLHDHYSNARKTLREADLDALGVGWLVLSRGDIEALEPEGRSALADPHRFEHVFDVTLDQEVREVYRIVRAGDGH